MPTVDEVTKKYIELRDRKAALVKEQAEATRPFNEAMEACENWLLAKMNELGVTSLKTEAGTPYKSVANAVSMEDPKAFKEHVFAPVLEQLNNYLTGLGYPIQPADLEVMQTLLRTGARWDIVDFRVGKKGTLEYMEQHETLPPGVALSSHTTINVRRS